MKRKQVTITVSVLFEYDSRHNDESNAAQIAAGLTVRPNLNTIDDRVQVIDTEITEVAL